MWSTCNEQQRRGPYSDRSELLVLFIFSFAILFAKPSRHKRVDTTGQSNNDNQQDVYNVRTCTQVRDEYTTCPSPKSGATLSALKSSQTARTRQCDDKFLCPTKIWMATPLNNEDDDEADSNQLDAQSEKIESILMSFSFNSWTVFYVHQTSSIKSK